MTARHGSFMQTATGRAFWCDDPRPEDVCIEDVALHLARINRFNGGMKRGVWCYSVAQHSVLVSYAVPAEYAREGLMHDAHEAYTQDLIRPNRNLLGEAYLDAEHACKMCVKLRFDVDVALWLPVPVKRVDLAVLATEQRDLMEPCEHDWCLPEPPLPERIVPWSAEVAHDAFMSRFAELFPEHAP